MVRRPLALSVVFASFLALAACSTTEPPRDSSPTDVQTQSPKCIALNPLTLDAISEQLTKEAAITSGEAVELAKPEMNLRYIAALQIEDSTKQVGMLAMGGTEPGDGPWIAADNVAQLYLDWGAAAKDGTPIKEAADRAWTSDEGTAAKECLG